MIITTYKMLTLVLTRDLKCAIQEDKSSIRKDTMGEDSIKNIRRGAVTASRCDRLTQTHSKNRVTVYKSLLWQEPQLGHRMHWSFLTPLPKKQKKTKLAKNEDCQVVAGVSKLHLTKGKRKKANRPKTRVAEHVVAGVSALDYEKSVGWKTRVAGWLRQVTDDGSAGLPPCLVIQAPLSSCHSSFTSLSSFHSSTPCLVKRSLPV